MKIHVHWVTLMKNQIIHKFQNLEIKKKTLQGKTFIFLMIWQKKCSMGSKCLALGVDGVDHM